MTALSAPRATPTRSGDKRSGGLAAATKIWQGAIVCLNAAGNLVPGSTATTLKALGRAPETYDNAAGAADAVTGEAEAGVFRFANSAAGDLIAKADIGADCYIVDDQTVAKTNGGATRSVAGKIFDVDANGVWVRFA